LHTVYILGVVFELRGKPFGLRDSGKPESIYALCRKWMYGKDDAADDELEALDEQPEFDVPRFKSLASSMLIQLCFIPITTLELSRI
jgi:hypothetical protein